MRSILLCLALSLPALPAWAAKDCESLKSEIDAKIRSHGVQAYRLEVVDTAATVDGRTVGSCDGGTKKIVYRRG
ncbi:DUF1161 domain-containing protein [Solimonas soli]|uniref:DUF1161 domain-containing protein n=1 Tax=Solimonas soli TaxID=413479 RepID=UPI000482E45E|nr:DUF1161 domain-containing protein [Solimonas soli]